MRSKATTVDAYLASLPDDRRRALEAVTATIRKNLGAGYEEGMQYGMIGYFVPHSVYPPGYHCDPKQPLPFAGLASQKNHMALYLFCVYQSEELREWFIEAWQAETAKGKAGKLDMGAGCVRFKKIEDVPLGVVGKAVKKVTVKKFIAQYEDALSQTKNRKPAAKKAAKTPAKKTTAKKVPKKKATTKKAGAKKATKKPGRS